MCATRLLLIRHGQTNWNLEGRIQGHLDVALNATGRWQAECLAAALAEREHPSALYSSDLLRAAETARIIGARLGLAVTTNAQLRERHLGRFQGQTRAWLREQEPEAMQHWNRRSPTWRPPGGETLLEFQQRVLAAMESIAAHHAGQLVAVVSHGGALDVLYRAAVGAGLKDAGSWAVDNTSVGRMLWTPDSGLGLVGWNDCSHLENQQAPAPP